VFSSDTGVHLVASLLCPSFRPTMPTSSTAHRATEPTAHQLGASNAPIPVPAATTDRFPSRGTSEPVDGSPPGTGPVTPLKVCEARIRKMAHHQQEVSGASRVGPGRQDNTGLGTGWAERQGKARQGKARQGKARQGKARQGKARQGDPSLQDVPLPECRGVLRLGEGVGPNK
jgi:hypothetical protein